MEAEFDRIDRRLLAELDRNSRQSYSQIAKKLRLGNDLIEYRIRRYVAEGYIGRFSAVVDPLSAGWWVFKHYLKLNSGSKKLKRLLLFLGSHPRTYWLAELHGRFDLLVSICVSNPAEGQRFQDELHSQFGDIIREQQICVLTSVVRFSKKYLTGGSGLEYEFAHRSDASKLTAEDAQLANLLYLDARQSLGELARRLSVSPATVSRRIEMLERRGIILGYRFQLNYAALDMLLFKLLVQPTDHSTTFNDKLRAFCREHPQVTCFIRQLGPFPLEIEVEVNGFSEMNSFVEEFRERFDSGISAAEALLIKEDRFHRFPEDSPS
ncbi:MAG: winged helix-turn-helix transcriptional regulator [Bdellovibrionota bacterium]